MKAETTCMLLKDTLLIALGYCYEIGTKKRRKNDIISCTYTLYNNSYFVINYRI